MCVVLHNMLRTHQGGEDTALTPANDVTALQNEQAVYVPNENYRNPSREASHPRKLLKDYISHMGALAWQEDRSEMCQPTTLGAEAGIYQSFSGLPNNFKKKKILKLVLLKFPSKIQSIPNKFQKYFEPNHKSSV